MKSVIVCALILFFVGPAAAEDFLPLETGNFWSYIAENEYVEMRVVGEQVPIFQGNPFEIHYTFSIENQGLINFWSSEPDGGVLLWGFFRDDFGYLYQPPIRMVDAPLYVGKAWSTAVDIYALPDTSFVQTAEFTFEVLEDPELTVPAGVFPTFGIGENDPNPGSDVFLEGRFTPSGEARSHQTRGVYDWYSIGVGRVQEYNGIIYQLKTYVDHPVPVEVSSWGGVKALYRGVE